MSKSGSGTDHKAQQAAWANLNNVFGQSQKTAQQLGQTGTGTQAKGVADLAQAGDYWKTLLSGDRAATMQAVAPAANAATTQADAAKRQEAAMGTGRGGGTNAGNQERATNTQSQIDTLIGSEKGKAAEGLTAVGTDIAGIGTADIEAMLQSMGIGVSAESAVGSQATSADAAARQAQAELWSSLIKGASDIGAAVIGA